VRGRPGRRVLVRPGRVARALVGGQALGAPDVRRGPPDRLRQVAEGRRTLFGLDVKPTAPIPLRDSAQPSLGAGHGEFVAMEFGIGYFPTHDAMSPGAFAALIEERGHHSLVFAEHTHIPASRESPYPSGGAVPRKYIHCHDPI